MVTLKEASESAARGKGVSGSTCITTSYTSGVTENKMAPQEANESAAGGKGRQ